MSSALLPVERAPEPPTGPPNLGSVEHEMRYTGNTGNDMGISTAGYRANKYTPDDWHNTNYARYYQSFTDRDHCDRVQNTSKKTIGETEALTNKTQADTTENIRARLRDIEYWKHELKRTIDDMIAEIKLMHGEKERLESALRATEIPLHIATECLEARQGRQETDAVKDGVEAALIKEVETINNVRDLLKKTLEQSIKQQQANRDRKHELEMDWSDKLEARQRDHWCGNLKNTSPNIMFHPGASHFQGGQSDPESWAQFTHDNIVRAENERTASGELRKLIDAILFDIQRDMRAHADEVERQLALRLEEMEEARNKLETHLDKTVKAIAAQEKNIADLKAAIQAKENPMKVAQSRLEHRSWRPNVELCRDPPQFQLVKEVDLIGQSIDALLAQVNAAERSLKDMMDTRMMLEKEIAIKKNSLFIDKDKCFLIRNRYPTSQKLIGYNN